jgi:hypothetical protein
MKFLELPDLDETNLTLSICKPNPSDNPVELN